MQTGRIDHGEYKASDFDDVRQPEIADETGNTYNAEIITDKIEISTAKWTTDSSNKVSANDCDSDRQPEIAIWLSKPEIDWLLIAPKLLQIASKFRRQFSNFGQ